MLGLCFNHVWKSGSFVRLDRLRLGFEGLAQVKLNPFELFQVEAGEAVQGRGPWPGKSHAHEATVAPAVVLMHQAFPASPLHKAHHSVVPFLQKLRQFADGCPAAPGIACDSQEQEVLLRGQAVLTRSPLAKAKKAAKIVAEPGKPPDYRGAR
jgi:hypothetical protein